MRTNNKGNFKMLENAEKGLRYEFYTRAIRKSNVDDTIAYYEPIVRICTKLTLGSTYSERRVSVEEGNALYQKLKAEGYILVTRGTQSFA